MNGLTSTELKIARAKFHLESLNKAVEHWITKEADQPFFKEDIDANEFVFVIPVATPPGELGLPFGDWVCCLRSALDHLAYALAAIGGKEGRRTCFPIEEIDSLDTQINITKATYGMPPDAITQVKNLQPYGRGRSTRAPICGDSTSSGTSISTGLCPLRRQLRRCSFLEG
jgi:hypothetical protein